MTSWPRNGWPIADDALPRQAMHRPLVLANEAARHPFRRTLPPPLVGVVASNERKPLGPVGLFTLTFVSAFLAFSGFLA